MLTKNGNVSRGCKITINGAEGSKHIPIFLVDILHEMPFVFWSIGITLEESAVNFRGHINLHEDGIRGRTKYDFKGSLIQNYRNNLFKEINCVLPAVI